MSATTYEQVRRELKGHLVEYLVEKEVVKSGRTKGTFKCINPLHEDRHPSMSAFTTPDGTELVHCHSCGFSADIFMAHNILDNAPLVGWEFVTLNVKKLAEQFNIDFEPRPMTEDEIEEMNVHAVLGIVQAYIFAHFKHAKKINPAITKYLNEKLLTLQDAETYKFGIVPNWEALYSELISRGISDKLIKKAGIEPFIFNENNVIFTICDEHGYPRAFAGRNCLYNKDDGGSKYVNSRATILYNKSQILYNIHRAIKRNVDIYNSLYIVEGNTDAIALDKNGLRTAAVSGTAMTADHIMLLQKLGITDIVLLLDGDKAGKKSTGSAITKLMEGIRNFRVRILVLPEEEDPESFIVKFGKEALLNIPLINTFEWRLMELKHKTDLDQWEIAKQAIPLIINERSAIARDEMCTKLAELCDIPVTVIRKEILLISNDKDIKAKQETEAVLDGTIKMLKRNPEDALVILAEARVAIKKVSERKGNYIYDEKECLEYVSHLELLQESQEYKDTLYMRRMPRLENQLNGTLTGKVLMLGAQPNAGKTSFFANIIANIILSDKGDYRFDIGPSEERKNNVSILWHSVDDSRIDIVPRLIAILAHERFKEITINLASAPYKYEGKDLNLFLVARKEAYETVKQWIIEGRLVIKDSTHGTTLSSAGLMVDSIKQKFPGRRVLYFLDNLYDLTDLPNIEDENKRMKLLGGQLKNFTIQEDMTSFVTVEYKKSGENQSHGYQALNQMVSGTKALEYDASWIGHLLNDMHVNPDTTDMYFSEKAFAGGVIPREHRLPIITLRTGKNKITQYKGDSHYFFVPHKAMFIEMHRNNLHLVHPSIRGRFEEIYGLPTHADEFFEPISKEVT